MTKPSDNAPPFACPNCVSWHLTYDNSAGVWICDSCRSGVSIPLSLQSVIGRDGKLVWSRDTAKKLEVVVHDHEKMVKDHQKRVRKIIGLVPYNGKPRKSVKSKE